MEVVCCCCCCSHSAKKDGLLKKRDTKDVRNQCDYGLKRIWYLFLDGNSFGVFTRARYGRGF